ncbi:MAG: plastocyanin/azurin family copper-binding protein, partial [Gemmatimonadota bacterium]
VVEWVYGDDTGQFHTVTPDGHDEWAEQDMPDGADPFYHTFEDSGEFPYFCDPHQSVGMTGSVTVE